ncbi:ferritin-like domain-containing protein [Thermostichus vulcanus]|uniref:Ferritin-like domain-containing protein n=1 Tax=Thermostichus vulcanus str. 'Rupite' TaxID=2813851 RepID=A0ABT0C8S8_THEVL|nr:ferritin-like domain-containing protein [Thermostichus vulcanus]MCJ2542197.1 ferritin-like domain-containing protein [Thermostichus vulcanus str. 'Rupite']
MTATLSPELSPENVSTAYTWAAFVQEIESEIEAHRDRAFTEAREQAFAPPETEIKPWPKERLIEWLSFQTYYEYQAILFISRWLQDTPETDALVLLCHQIEDESNHFRWLNRHLEAMGASLQDWQPLPEIKAWVETFYGSLPDTISRLAAHNLAGESGACRSFASILPHLPPDLQKTMRKIMPDEQFHLNLGRQILSRYCKTDEQKARARHYALQVADLESQAITAFNRKLAALA